ncbi:hypothetical protein DFP73DRAFT_544641, partial [Morchella snyderi]
MIRLIATVLSLVLANSTNADPTTLPLANASVSYYPYALSLYLEKLLLCISHSIRQVYAKPDTLSKSVPYIPAPRQHP